MREAELEGAPHNSTHRVPAAWPPALRLLPADSVTSPGSTAYLQVPANWFLFFLTRHLQMHTLNPNPLHTSPCPSPGCGQCPRLLCPSGCSEVPSGKGHLPSSSPATAQGSHEHNHLRRRFPLACTAEAAHGRRPRLRHGHSRRLPSRAAGGEPGKRERGLRSKAEHGGATGAGPGHRPVRASLSSE